MLKNGQKYSTFELNSIKEFVEMFKINVYIYSLLPDNSLRVVYTPYREAYFPDTMHLNLYKNHLSYVNNVEGYLKKFVCPKCEKVCSHKGHLERHQKTCLNVTKLNCPGGVYQPKEKLSEKMIRLGFPAATFYPYFAFWDSESILLKIEKEVTNKLLFLNEHKPVSISICSNVPGHREAKCLVNQNVDTLLDDFVKELEKIQETPIKKQ